MKKLILLLLCLPCVLGAQESEGEILRNAFNDLRSGHLSDPVTPYYAFNKKNETAKLVEGSQYLSDEWQDGLVLMSNLEGYEIKGRYDIHNDEIQILTKGKIQAIQPSLIKAVALGKQIFVYEEFGKNKKKTQKGYVEVLVEGRVSLFLRRRTKTKKANHHPVLGSTNDDFKVVIKEDLYYRKKHKFLQPLPQKRKSVIKALASRRKAVTEFAKNEQLSVKSIKDLIRLFNFYNRKDS